MIPNTNDIWARDYMPVQVSKDKFIEFRYDPDYLQGNSEDIETRELKTYTDIVCDSLGLKTIKTDIILDGGNVVKSENAIILTDKIVWENKRHYTKKKMIKELHNLFEVDKVVLIPWDEKCEYGHADGMLRFINPDTVLISSFYETVDDDFKKLILECLDKAELDRKWLRVSEKETEDNIAYINFLQTKDFIIIPSLNKKEDNEAIKVISKCFPDYASLNKIEKVDMRDIVRFKGALNCISWTKLE
ncbi:MAG: agmatine deiminase family protein [Chlorobi bacterium]|nr:agmatine deiminase family protein [Chlorobiota bacterium]